LAVREGGQICPEWEEKKREGEYEDLRPRQCSAANGSWEHGNWTNYTVCMEYFDQMSTESTPLVSADEVSDVILQRHSDQNRTKVIKKKFIFIFYFLIIAVQNAQMIGKDILSFFFSSFFKQQVDIYYTLSNHDREKEKLI